MSPPVKQVESMSELNSIGNCKGFVYQRRIDCRLFLLHAIFLHQSFRSTRDSCKVQRYCSLMFQGVKCGVLSECRYVADIHTVK
jgi:hypothetical protein